MALNRKYGTMSDAQKIAAYLDGDSPALPALINSHKTKLKGFLIRRVGRSLVEDVMQDTWVEVIKAFLGGTYIETGHFKTFLYKIASEKAIDAIRKEHPGRYRHEPVPETADDALTPDELALAHERTAL